MAQNPLETKGENSEQVCRKMNLERKRLKSSMEKGRQEIRKGRRGKASVELRGVF